MQSPSFICDHGRYTYLSSSRVVRSSAVTTAPSPQSKPRRRSESSHRAVQICQVNGSEGSVERLMIGGREHQIERLRLCFSIDLSSSGRELEGRCRGQRIEQSGFSKWSL
ncbi:hypothetical protein Rs2_41325 [Raphanus sativus]|nr:hypothetical protein Rs2_41325 [Raphanus sativus]